MSDFNSVSKLNGLFKDLYADSIESLLPENKYLTSIFKYRDSEQIGNQFVQPVALSYEGGFTAADGVTDIFDLNSSVSMELKPAKVDGYQLAGTFEVGYNEAARASHSKGAFKDSVGLRLENAAASGIGLLEIMCLYGQDHLGSIASTANVDTTHTIITLSSGEWASGIWAGRENSIINVLDHTGAVIGSSAADKKFVIEFVDEDAKAITVSGVHTSGIGALDTAVSGHANDCDIVWAGFHGKEFAGLKKIMTNTGELFGIDAATTSQWKSNTISESGELTMKKILKAANRAVSRGCKEKLVVLLNPGCWVDVMAQLASSREFDGSYQKGKAVNGFATVSFTSMNGELELVPLNIVKEKDVFLVPVKRVKRIGAQDLSFKDPTKAQDEIFYQVAGRTSVAFRNYSHQALFCSRPSFCVYMYGCLPAA